MDQLMDDAEAVGAVCRLGRELEEGMISAEAEAEIRRWRPMPNGGHDPECVRSLREAAAAEGNAWGCLRGVLPGNITENGENTGGAEKK